MGSPGREVQAMFAEIAPQYDLLNRVLSFGVDQRWRKYTVRQLGLPPGSPLLDLCCGTGDLSLAFARSGVAVTGADFAAPMLPLARKKLSQRQLPGQWLQADAQHLPFPDASFDAVTIAFGIRNVEQPEQGLAECARVLRPEGRLAILEFFPIETRFWGPIFRFYFHRILPILARIVPAGRTGAYRYLPNSVEDFATATQFRQWMREAGVPCECDRALTGGIARLVIGRKPGEVAS